MQHPTPKQIKTQLLTHLNLDETKIVLRKLEMMKEPKIEKCLVNIQSIRFYHFYSKIYLGQSD